MDPRELLLTLAEVGVTLAALSAVAGVIEYRGTAEPQPGRIRVRFLRDVAVLGMLAALLAVLPLALEGNTSEGATTWRWCSGAALAVWIVNYITFLREAVRAVGSEEISWVWGLAGLAITLLGFGLLGWNLIWPSEADSQRYALAIVCLLVLSGLDFLAGAFFLRSGSPAA